MILSLALAIDGAMKSALLNFYLCMESGVYLELENGLPIEMEN